MYEIKNRYVYENFNEDKEMFSFSNYLTKWKYHDDSNKLVITKMKNKTARIAIKEFLGLKAKIYFFLVDDSSEGKKAKGMNKNVAITSIINTKVFCWIRNAWGIKRAESKVKIVE